MITTRLTILLGIDHPIVSAPMTRMSGARQQSRANCRWPRTARHVALLTGRRHSSSHRYRPGRKGPIPHGFPSPMVVSYAARFRAREPPGGFLRRPAARRRPRVSDPADTCRLGGRGGLEGAADGGPLGELLDLPFADVLIGGPGNHFAGRLERASSRLDCGQSAQPRLRLGRLDVHRLAFPHRGHRNLYRRRPGKLNVPGASLSWARS